MDDILLTEARLMDWERWVAKHRLVQEAERARVAVRRLGRARLAPRPIRPDRPHHPHLRGRRAA